MGPSVCVLGVVVVDWRGHLRALGAAVIVLPLVWWPFLAVANPYLAAWNVIKTASGGKVVLPTASNLLRQFQLSGASLAALPGGGVNAAASVALPVGNTMVGATAGQALSRAALLRGAARVATVAGPAGVAIGLALEFARCEADGGLIRCEDGQPESMQTIERWDHDTRIYAMMRFGSALEACEAYGPPVGTIRNFNPMADLEYVGISSGLVHYKCVRTFEAWSQPSQAWSWFTQKYDVYARSGQGMGCPSGTMKVAGLCFSEVGGDLVGPTTVQGAEALADRLLNWRNNPGWPTGATDLDVAHDLANAPSTVNPFQGETLDAPSLSGGPATADGGSKTSTKVNADGTKTQTTTTTTHNITYNQNTYNVTTVTTTIIQNFDENDDPLGPPVTEEETQTPPAVDPNAPTEPVEDLECGLPGYPPCKIDEQGTPPPEDPFEEPDGWFDPIRGVFDNPPTADTAWSWSFSLPSSCSVLTVGTFAGHTVTLDLCQWQPMIHSIVSMVWLIAGIWVGVGMVGRTLGGT